jgi:hypothetical protein
MQKEKPESLIDSAKRAGRFAKEKPSSVKALQEFAQREAEKKKKKDKIDASPSPGVIDKISKPRKKGDDIVLPLSGMKKK